VIQNTHETDVFLNLVVMPLSLFMFAF